MMNDSTKAASCLVSSMEHLPWVTIRLRYFFRFIEKPNQERKSMNTHAFVFVTGLHRSGTSPLHRCLRAHPQMSGFHNTNVPEDEGQHLQTVLPRGGAYGGPGRFGRHPEVHMTETHPLATPETAHALFAQWAPYWDLEKPYLIEKTPMTLLRTRMFQALFPNSFFIVIIGCDSRLCGHRSPAGNRHEVRLLRRTPGRSQMQHGFCPFATPAHPCPLHPPLNRCFATGLHHAAAYMIAPLTEGLVQHAMLMTPQIVEGAFTHLLGSRRSYNPGGDVGKDLSDLIVEQSLFLQTHPRLGTFAALPKTCPSYPP